MKIKYQNIRTGEFDRIFDLHANQEKFIGTKSRFPLFSGGFGAGKTMPLVQKVIRHLEYPNNLGVLGRLKYTDLRDSVQKDFFDLCPPNWIKRWHKSENYVEMVNGSQLILTHFDKQSKESIKSMNLGFFAIDQVEQIEEDVFDALDGRLRRQIKAPEGYPPYVHQGMMTANPALFWAFKRYKQDKPSYDSNGNLIYELFESSTLDNRKNLPQEYVESLLRKPEAWKRQFVYGVWDESLLAEDAYFPIEYIQEQAALVKQPIRVFEGIDIYREVEWDDQYQMGIDPTEGVHDMAVIIVASKKLCEVVATWVGRIPPDKLGEQAAKVGRIYRKALAIPEMNSMGYATLAKLREVYDGPIYRREEFDSITRKKVEKYGWRTTISSKALMLSHFLELLSHNRIRLNDPYIIEEMKTFIYTDVAKKDGLGAKDGFYDDRIMATALAFWGLDGTKQEFSITPAEPPRGSVSGVLEEIMKSKSKGYIGQFK